MDLRRPAAKLLRCRSAAPNIQWRSNVNVDAPSPRNLRKNAAKDSQNKVLNEHSINENVKRAQYAVRGRIAIRAEELRQQLRNPNHGLPFNKVVNVNIGNPQQLDQKPITFYRQVIALTEYPNLLDDENLPTTKKLFPEDAIVRARDLLTQIGSTGAYSVSQGILPARKSVAEFITRRDGFKTSPADIFLISGASAGVHNLFKLMMTSSSDGVMIPIPQYPLYSAAVALYNGQMVPYYLDENDGWSIHVDELKSSITKARADGINVKACCVINPGNPTGSVLSEQSMLEVLRFCKRENILLVADEVYQTNVFCKPWRSFRSLLKTLEKQEPNAGWDNLELASLHTISKGQVGECGKRGGYIELTNFTQAALDQFYKLASIELCPPVPGQIMVQLMVDPPKPGDQSYDRWRREVSGIQDTMRERATLLQEAFKKMSGISCQKPEGAMYLFPKIELPHRLIEKARADGMEPDEFYCLHLLNRTGICVVPGSGFGQKPGQYFFRITFLEGGEEFVNNLVKGHNDIMSEYA